PCTTTATPCTTTTSPATPTYTIAPTSSTTSQVSSLNTMTPAKTDFTIHPTTVSTSPSSEGTENPILELQTNFCYIGGSCSTLNNIRHLLICGDFCLDDSACLGINFRVMN
ncbi:unnamed protein product, partial [Lymnaea stagnalis]